MKADVSDGLRVFDGTVTNISRKGLRLQDIPKKFNFYSKKCIAVVNSSGKNYKLLVKPRWSKAQGESKDIGFQIISPSLDWIKFINELDDREVAISATLH